jgi:hypothetical protein
LTLSGSRCEKKLLVPVSRAAICARSGSSSWKSKMFRFSSVPYAPLHRDRTIDARLDLIWPRLEPWLKLYPDIKVEISGDNRFTDNGRRAFRHRRAPRRRCAKDMIAVLHRAGQSHGRGRQPGRGGGG